MFIPVNLCSIMFLTWADVLPKSSFWSLGKRWLKYLFLIGAPWVGLWWWASWRMRSNACFPNWPFLVLCSLSSLCPVPLGLLMSGGLVSMVDVAILLGPRKFPSHPMSLPNSVRAETLRVLLSEPGTIARWWWRVWAPRVCGALPEGHTPLHR